MNSGGKAVKRAKETLSIAIKIVTIAGSLCAAVLLVFRKPPVSVFVKGNPEVFQTATESIVFYSFSFVFVGANVVVNTILYAR